MGGILTWMRLLLAGLVLLVAGCTNLAPPTATTKPPASEQELRQIAAAYGRASTYRARLDGVDGAERVLLLHDIVKPDREHVTVSVGSRSFEAIKIGNDVYLNNQGKWNRITDPVQLPFSINVEEIIAELESGAKDGRVNRGAVGEADGVACQEWVLSPKARGEGGTICVGVADHLPRRMVLTDDAGTITFTGWNQPLNIDPPASAP